MRRWLLITIQVLVIYVTAVAFLFSIRAGYYIGPDGGGMSNSSSHLLFAVCIPSTWVSREEVTNKALPSILRSTHPIYEIIVAISGVPTLEDGKAWEETVRRAVPDTIKFTMVTDETQRYAGWARNAAASVATAPWLAFLDSDDVMHPLRLRATHDLIAQRPSLQLILHSWSKVQEAIIIADDDIDTEDGTRLLKVANSTRATSPLRLPLTANGQPLKLTQGHPTIRRGVMETHRFDTTIQGGEDAEFLRRVILGLALPETIAFMHAPFTVYVRRSKTSKQRIENNNNLNRIVAF